MGGSQPERPLMPRSACGHAEIRTFRGHFLDIAVEVNAGRFRGWKVGVISPRSPLFGGGVTYEEIVEDEDRGEARMEEMAQLVALHGPKLA